MKKLVIVVVFIVILLAAGYWYWVLRVPGLYSPEQAAVMAKTSCEGDIADMVFLLEALEGKRECDELIPVMKGYCLAYFGDSEGCSQLANSSACIAIVEHNPEGCDSDACYAILNDESGCVSPDCVAVARRDLEGIKSPAICQESIDLATSSVLCMNNAKTVEEFDACRSVE